MKRPRRNGAVRWRLAVVGMLALPLAACGTGNTAAPSLPPSGSPSAPGAIRSSAPGSEKPVAPETNPPGDIPDTQTFVKFASAAGAYQLEVPEGWARTEQGAGATFVSKLDGVQVAVSSASSVPTVSSVQAAQVAALKKSGRAVTVDKVQQVQLPAGPAVMVSYTSNSDPNAVTGKQVRLENNSYLYFKGGNLATLRMWAPYGADNVDQWQHMAQSFGWS